MADQGGTWREAHGGPDEQGHSLVNRRIRIWWDGDSAFYNADVVAYVSETGKHKVIYVEDTDIYEEDLSPGKQRWELLDGSASQERRDLPGRAAKPTSFNAAHFTSPSSSGKKATYADMALEAIADMKDKNGSSLPSIRKWIQNNFTETREKQKASFNSLSIKALAKLVSDGVLEKVKHSFRLSQDYLREEKRREREEAKAKGGIALLRLQVTDAKGKHGPGLGMGSGGQRSNIRGRGRGGGETWEANKQMRQNYERRIQKRNEFLSER
ncbi:unnamed protein product [Choristocarpus tenellus]